MHLNEEQQIGNRIYYLNRIAIPAVHEYSILHIKKKMVLCLFFPCMDTYDSSCILSISIILFDGRENECCILL